MFLSQAFFDLKTSLFFYKRAADSCNIIYGPGHEESLRCQDLLVQIHSMMGDFKAALLIQQNVLNLLKEGESSSDDDLKAIAEAEQKLQFLKSRLETNVT